jgi:glucose-1-phosphate thymidylyltransferase
MWGIVPVASSEHAVAEHLVERMLRAGATRLCFVIAPNQTPILDKFGGAIGFAHVCYTVQTQPRGLTDAIFCALPLIHADEEVLVAPLDSIWFPEDALCTLPRGILSFLLFRAQSQGDPAVVMDDFGYVREIRSEATTATGAWTWRAFKAPVRVHRELHTMWLRRDRRDIGIESLVNEHFRRGGRARGVRSGTSYLRLGATLDRREALRLMTRVDQDQAVDIGPYLEPERAGAWSLGRAQPLPPPGDHPTSPSAA